jgi:hypothetical protein
MTTMTEETSALHVGSYPFPCPVSMSLGSDYGSVASGVGLPGGAEPAWL